MDREGVIHFNDYGFKYRTQTKPTLESIHLKISRGEKILIVGSSGSGKSTLAHCINGLIPHSYKGQSTGSLKIAGKDINEQSIFDLSKLVGTILQDSDSQFIGLSVAEDLAFAMENDCIPQESMKERVREIADMVGMDEFLQSSIHELSGGQKQRVALGGVMVENVDILLFDEPLANLDPATGKKAVQLIKQIHEETNAAVIIIEHRIEDVLDLDVDRIIVMKDGRIVQDSSPSELFATSILETCHLREPLDVKALKYVGCKDRFDRTIAMEYREQLHQLFYRPLEIGKKENDYVLELQNLSFHYDGGRRAVEDLSFKIRKGEMVSIIGRNGAGKSTLAKLICGFERPQSGDLLIQGKSVLKDTIKERASRIGMVMQNPNHMISQTFIYDEVALGLINRGMSEDKVKQRVEKVLKICGLFPFRKWPISALSYGQKKRVTIASILVLEPEVIILDEPTAGQDYRHYTEVMEFLSELNRHGVTILLITHDMHVMLEYTPRAIVMSGGKKIADDASFSILANRAIIEQANLKETSLLMLANHAGIDDPEAFMNGFILYEKEAKRTWQ